LVVSSVANRKGETKHRNITRVILIIKTPIYFYEAKQ